MHINDVNYWIQLRRAAQLAECTLDAKIDLDRPDTGIRAESAALKRAELRVLSIFAGDTKTSKPTTWPAKLVDKYARGNDLIANYAGTESWPFAPQIYWTSESIDVGGASLNALSIVVSIQTDRLDTHPRIVVQSVLPTDDVVLVSVAGDEMLVDSHVAGPLRIDSRATACALVWRLPGDELSYAELMPTSDFHQLAVSRVGEHATQSRWEMFNEFLEKGVIRRARLQSLFVSRENDVQLIAECCQAIERKPLPLTT